MELLEIFYKGYVRGFFSTEPPLVYSLNPFKRYSYLIGYYQGQSKRERLIEKVYTESAEEKLLKDPLWPMIKEHQAKLPRVKRFVDRLR